MKQTTTFGPFHKDEIIDATYMRHIFLPKSLIKKWVWHAKNMLRQIFHPTITKRWKTTKSSNSLSSITTLDWCSCHCQRIIGDREVFGLPMVSPLACQGTTSITSGGTFMYPTWETKPQTMPMMMMTMLVILLMIFREWRLRGTRKMIKITKTKME